jgi:hypothetical protein
VSPSFLYATFRLTSFDSADVSSALTFQFSGKIDDTLRVTLLIFYFQDSLILPVSNPFFPSLTFEMTSFSSTFDLRYLHAPNGIPNKLGRYSMVVNVTGMNGSGVHVIYPFGSEFTVKASGESVPGPKMKKAVFSFNGNKILVDFDNPTNGFSSKSLSNCSKLFRITSSSSQLTPSLSSTAVCG